MPDADLHPVDQANRAVSRLAVEVEQLRREVRRLRNNQRPGRHERVIHQAHADARTILMLRQAGFSASRRWLDEAGLVSAWRYGWSLGLLRYARLATIQPGDLEHLQRAVTRLDASVDKLLQQAPRDAMATLRGLAGARYRHNAAPFRSAGSGVATRTRKPA